MYRLVLWCPSSDYGTENRRDECQVCRSRGFENVKHKHFSTAYQRQIVMSRGSHDIECAVCQAVHPAEITSPRIKAFFSASTMFGLSLIHI